MRKRTFVLGTMLLALLIAGVCWAGPGMDDVDSGGEPQWTFIYYLAADNEEESFADNTLTQLLAGTDKVSNHPQILVMIDRLSVPGTEVFEIAGGEIIPLTTHEEQNSADGAVLQEFTDYALGLAEHDNVAFVMKSEGLSWRGIGRDNTHDEEVDDQLMSNGDLAEALITAQSLAGKNVDLLVLEGAIMAFMEVIYELRDAAPVLLASQSKIQPDGLPWEMIIETLGETPAMSNEELGIAITDSHLEYYSDKGNNGVPKADTSTNFAALTVFDLSQIDNVRDAHMFWAATTWPLFDDIYNILPHARDLSEVGGFGEITEFDYNFDILTFMLQGLRLIEEANLSFPELTAAVNVYLTEQAKLVIYERNPNDGFKLKAATGLSIWYPPTWMKYDTTDESDEVFGSTMYYEDPAIDLDWIEDSNWRTYLFEYFDRADANLAGNGPEGDEPPKPGVFDKIQ
jgi:cysteine peptidase C11 family protein